MTEPRMLHTRLQHAIGSMAPGLWPYYTPLVFEFGETKLRAVWNPSLTRPLIVEFYIDDCLTYTEQYPPLRGLLLGGPRVKCNRIVEYSPGLYYYLKKESYTKAPSVINMINKIAIPDPEALIINQTDT